MFKKTVIPTNVGASPNSGWNIRDTDLGGNYMVKKSSIFICNTCSFQTSKWMGKCSECDSWNSFIEETLAKQKVNMSSCHGSTSGDVAPRLINEVVLEEQFRIKTNIGEFDRVVGGGVVPGSLILIGGEPGIGKSTLLTSVTGELSRRFACENVLYVSGEESINQTAERAKRIGVSESSFYVYNETNWEKILEQIKKIKPKFLVIDSIQTTISSEVESPPGSISQIREVTHELLNHIKANDITCFVIGHITKEGLIAGPKILEHMVDTVIYFEGDQQGKCRILRAIKNRFGSTNEIGIFEMEESGLVDVKYPSKYFLDEEMNKTYGRSMTCLVEGTRPLVIEIQSLVADNKFGNGRRATQGFDHSRLIMMTAVIEKYLGISLGFCDIYLNIIGGIKLSQRDSDLSVMASILSSYWLQPISSDVIFAGEIGLTGEIRTVSKTMTIVRELIKLNYKKLVVSEKIAQEYSGKYKIDLIGFKNVSELKSFFNN